MDRISALRETSKRTQKTICALRFGDGDCQARKPSEAVTEFKYLPRSILITLLPTTALDNAG
jgi:hypothetical protein